MAGYNKGIVSATYATGSTYGGTYAGGLVGLNDTGGVIQNSYSTGSLRGGNRLGGLVGVNQGAVTDSYSFVSITDVAGQDLFGGLVGHNNGGSITRSYATGLVNVQVPTNNAGALVGLNGGSISNSYWNTDTNSVYGLSGIGAGTATGSTGLTSAQMQALSTFASWDIDDVGGTGKVWRIYDGDSSPLLRSLLTPLTVTAVNDLETTYDGAAKSGGNGYVGGSADASKILYGGSAQGAKNVGSYGLYIYSSQNGYDLIGSRFSSSGLTITPAPLTVTANNASKTYDGAAYSGGNDVAYSGFVNSETFSVLGGTLGYSGSSQGATNAGSYTITPGGLTSNNYTVSFVNGALTIAPRAITVTADAKSKVSGDADPSLTYQVTTGSLVGSDSLNGALTRATGETAGAYAIGQGTVTDTSNPNYQIAYLGADLTVNAAPTSNRTTATDQSITQAAITIATQTASQTARSGDSGNGSVGVGTTTSTASFSPSRVDSPTGANNNGGLALVEVADAPPTGQNTSTSNVGGFMTVFVVNGGINTGNSDILPTTAR